jgi:hypothetical protein
LARTCPAVARRRPFRQCSLSRAAGAQKAHELARFDDQIDAGDQLSRAAARQPDAPFQPARFEANSLAAIDAEQTRAAELEEIGTDPEALAVVHEGWIAGLGALDADTAVRFQRDQADALRNAFEDDVVRPN